MNELKIGQRIFNHGDMCNQSHFGTIVCVTVDKWGVHYNIQPDGDGKSYWVEGYTFSDEYKGNGMTRMVTKEAYDEYRQAQIKELENFRAKYAKS